MYLGLEKHIPFIYSTPNFIRDAKSVGVDEILMKLEIDYTGCGCCSGTDNFLVLSDPKERVKRHKARKISVNGLGYSAEEYCKIARAAEQLKHELKGFNVIYDGELTNFLKKCKEFENMADSVI